MLTINRVLEDRSREVERVYLKDSDLGVLERYASDFAHRAKTYNLLRDRSEDIVQRSIQLMSLNYPNMIAKLADRCKYDMSNVLRYIALAILRDDEQFFRDQMGDWLSTVLCAYQVSTECSMAYRKMQEVINTQLPNECAILIKPYIDMTVMSLSRND
ncbi:phycocyanin [Tumidithrix elongata RA019]|uniref:Phycocyanin n=1 Tax=Tumidithrix elongata BACA0141 TaxID=2716417 RepID=A0AAW9PZ27_9CYAN|nr:phycocyanin [Tumidithrix elongata RA019]